VLLRHILPAPMSDARCLGLPLTRISPTSLPPT
jgi:hypothetical protein